MRQAGRWDPEFNRLRAGRPFYEFSENVELSAQASLLPRRFGVDAIILFYDITTLTVAMGLPFTLQPAVGPLPDQPVRTLTDVRRLDPQPDPERFGHVRQLLQRVRAELNGALPVLVFAGAPFTLATYCIGTGKDLAKTRQFAGESPDVWQELLDRLGTATRHFLATLVRERADAYQLFDSWAGMLERPEYERWAQPYHQAIFADVSQAPRILFVKEGPYLDLMAASGADVVSLGVRPTWRPHGAIIPTWFSRAMWTRSCCATEPPNRWPRQPGAACGREAASATSSTSITGLTARLQWETSRFISVRLRTLSSPGAPHAALWGES
jgi:uroporphyrinogen decarboxylase